MIRTLLNYFNKNSDNEENIIDTPSDNIPIINNIICSGPTETKILDESKLTDHISQNRSSNIDTSIKSNGKVTYYESDLQSYKIISVRKNDDINDEDLTVDLPDLSWEFVVGDKVQIIETTNEKGQLEITDLIPKKKKDFEYGRVTGIEKTYAIFEDKIVLMFSAVRKYPLLKMHDEYKFIAIQSDQKFDARIFDYRIIDLLEKIDSQIEGNGIVFENKSFKIHLEPEKKDIPNISITRCIIVMNKSNTSADLIGVKAVSLSPDATDIIQLDKEGTVINYNLNAKNGKFKIFFKIRPKKIGIFQYELIATFKNFEEKFEFSIEVSHSYVLPGQRFRKSPRFIEVRLEDHPVPSELKEIDYNKIQGATEKLIELYPYLNQETTTENYIKKMKMGIYLEEIAMEKAFSSYRIDRGVFGTKGAYLKLIVRDVAEKRPSIIIGDKVIATDPFRSDDDKPIYEGFIHKVEKESVLCKFHTDFHHQHNEKEFTIDFGFSRSTFRRQQHALNQTISNNGLGFDFLFPNKTIIAKHRQIDASINSNGDLLINQNTSKWYNNQLNKYQKDAVVNVLLGEYRPLPYLYFGCPGSGKTQTVVETILQIYTLMKTSKLIIATPSNSAANLITEMLIESGVFDQQNPSFIRIVSNNQVEKDLVPDNLIKFCATVSIASDDGQQTPPPIKNSRGMMQNITKSKIAEYRIIIATLNGLGSLMQMNFIHQFTHVIIDEAGQSIEPETLIPLTLMNKYSGQCVLAGDPKQLGPILTSRFGKIFKFNVSFLERLLLTHPYYAQNYGENGNDFDPKFVTKLKINYRSHPTIMKVYNDLFYNGELESAVDEEDSIESMFLSNTDDVLWKNTNRKCGIYFVNVSNGKNRKIPDSCSWYNEEEMRGILSFLNKCISKRIPFKDIGIVTPYALQVKKLKHQVSVSTIDTDLKIGTVEEFQGQERLIMIVSTVRSDERHITNDAKFGLGFLQCPKRMNVAISRARALLVVFGKEAILEKDAGWKRLIEYSKENRTYVIENY